MNLGLEYLLRTNAIKHFVEFPCSFFLTTTNQEKIVITLHSRDNDIIGKQWDIGQCLPQQALPPMSEFQVSNLEQAQKKINQYKILTYCEMPIPNNYNSWRSPMPNYIYENYVNNFTTSSQHRRKKEIWLWKAFMRVYDINLTCHNQLSKHSIMQSQINYLKNFKLKYWKFWFLWKKHLFSHLDGELFFQQLPT